MIPSAEEDLITIQRRAAKRELVVFLKNLRDRRDKPPGDRTRGRA